MDSVLKKINPLGMQSTERVTVEKYGDGVFCHAN